MAWYAYCVAEKQAFPELQRHRKPVPLESVAGLDGNQVFLYPASDLAVLVSEHVASETNPQQSAKDHARVIAECFRSATVLPFRFGTVFANDELLRRSIRSNQRQFLTNLSHLHGKSEMHIRLTLDDCCREQNSGTISSRTYLSDLRESATRNRERQTLARSLTTQLNRMFAPLSEEISCRRLENGKMQLDVSHLILSKQVERYVNKFATVREIMRDCHMQLTGPRPAYHFVGTMTPARSTPATMPAPAVATQARAIPA
jgi:hypothetical protein